MGSRSNRTRLIWTAVAVLIFILTFHAHAGAGPGETRAKQNFPLQVFSTREFKSPASKEAGFGFRR